MVWCLARIPLTANTTSKYEVLLETSEVAFFGQDALPQLSTARVTLRQIARLFAHHANRGLPTEFD